MTGKLGTAPCGHPGEHITARYVKCLVGCDGTVEAVPKYVPPEKTRPYCGHRGGYFWKNFWWCTDCGKNLGRDKPGEWIV